jgi:hypothetical protein
MQVVKQRMQTGQFASAHGAVRQIVGAEGVRGLYAVWKPCVTWRTYILGRLQLYVDLYVFVINIHKINEAGYYGLDGTVSRDLDHFCYETCPLMQFSSASMSSSGLSVENWYSINLSGTCVFVKRVPYIFIYEVSAQLQGLQVSTLLEAPRVQLRGGSIFVCSVYWTYETRAKQRRILWCSIVLC